MPSAYRAMLPDRRSGSCLPEPLTSPCKARTMDTSATAGYIPPPPAFLSTRPPALGRPAGLLRPSALQHLALLDEAPYHPGHWPCT